LQTTVFGVPSGSLQATSREAKKLPKNSCDHNP
jgi:hypothetical protein